MLLRSYFFTAAVCIILHSFFTALRERKITNESSYHLLIDPVRNALGKNKNNLFEARHFFDDDLERESSAKTINVLIAINALVYMGWQVPSLVPFMMKHFTQTPVSPPYTLITSAFSHQSLAHFLLSINALQSIGRLLHMKMGRERFLSMYLQAAVFSSFGSQMWKTLANEEKSSLSNSYSLGASGAIFSMLGALSHSKDHGLKSSLFPFLTLSAFQMAALLGAFDLFCLVFRPSWNSLDNAAHLAGLGFGYLYILVLRSEK